MAELVARAGAGEVVGLDDLARDAGVVCVDARVDDGDDHVPAGDARHAAETAVGERGADGLAGDGHLALHRGVEREVR